MDWLVFLPACLALNLAFGPNNLLSLTNGATNGVTFAMGAGFGRLMAFVPMIAISAVGLGVILQTSAIVFTIMKAAGAAYLIWLGIRLLRDGGTVVSEDRAPARSFGAAACTPTKTGRRKAESRAPSAGAAPRWDWSTSRLNDPSLRPPSSDGSNVLQVLIDKFG